jgi:xanthine/CO dehydrogenase XdhC/CoxF family maturation factor
VIQDGEPRNVHVDLTEDISMQSLGVCGGIMNVFIEQWRQEENDANQVALTE